MRHCWANFKICSIQLLLLRSFISLSHSHYSFYTCNQLKISFHISSYFDHFILVTHIFSASAAKKNDRKFSFHVFIVFSNLEVFFFSFLLFHKKIWPTILRQISLGRFHMIIIHLFAARRPVNFRFQKNVELWLWFCNSADVVVIQFALLVKQGKIWFQPYLHASEYWADLKTLETSKYLQIEKTKYVYFILQFDWESKSIYPESVYVCATVIIF